MRNNEKHNKLDISNIDVFSSIYRRYYALLCFFSYKIVNDEPTAEDLVNEIFIQLLNRKDIFNDDNHLKSYLYRAVQNSSLNSLRSSTNIKNREKKYFLSQDEWEDDIQNHVIRAEIYDEIHQAIQSLPTQSGKVIRLAYLEGKKNKEIAEIMNISEQTVKNHKQNGLKHLKKTLNKDIFYLLMLFVKLDFFDYLHKN